MDRYLINKNSQQYIVNESMQEFKKNAIELHKVGDCLSGHHPSFAKYMKGSKKAGHKQLLLFILALILLHYSRAIRRATKEMIGDLED
ncbi:hypothetical protein AB751O23_CD_00020 [Chlamydiales bacterium SCGC AB-751-O23]|jgi:hypothetical protein|nr:hypothetical protein AB751O23_CD_00020 [Chlamydiales bacterium SCGC AB-751-O23]